MPHPYLRLALFLTLLCPLGYWFYQAWTFALGPDPGRVLLWNLGQWSLGLLLATLCMSPLQQLTGWRWIAFRRQLGLWSFAYALLHLLAYLSFVLGFEWSQLAVEIQRRPYILVGFLAFLVLLPLAGSSNRRAMRLLGKKWKPLHRLVYLAVCLGLLHMLWIARSDIGNWAVYAVIFAILMVLRVGVVRAWLIKRRPARNSE
ncbi:protein-methionine-sulfoxide reductase heme-binding subunit MsrQ [Pseudomonas matsuisoli]|uniref:Protein-methionine-sulfoxide reductase heme-binding subunit MsrQ n=1 Tax=Pseudomonas matsuisoli TaxID=1515666 RepID=A0A917PYI2_9PSED|nr:protein-methionine-sulfoxide reductase heme-binding subunit MsrQ [Pseudomonas matsuisoli]GGJ99633.1 protein-methionine-sulfoxide reductase heme-binding subunit MsrQ [Pseudomonas matsuisoli]